MAQTLATLDELTGGRIVLAPGACTEKHARRHGLAPFTPAVTLREWIEAHPAASSPASGSRTSGQSFEMERAALNWTAPRADDPVLDRRDEPDGPAGWPAKIADGVLLDAHTSPEYVENAVVILREAVQKAGRDWASFEVAQIVPCSVEDTHEEAVDAVRWEAASRFESPNFAAETERRLRVGEPAVDRRGFPDDEGGAGSRRASAAVAQVLPKSLVENTTATGTPDEVLARVERYRKAGVTFPLVRPQAPHQIPRVLDLFAKKQ